MRLDARIAAFLLGMVCFFVGTPPWIAADSVEVEGNQRIEGIILRQTDQVVEIQTAGGRLSLARERIRSLEKEPEGVNLLQEAEANLRRGRRLEAAQELEESLNKGLDVDALRLWCVRKTNLLEHTLHFEEAGSMGRWTNLLLRLGGIQAIDGAPLGASALPCSATLSTLGSPASPAIGAPASGVTTLKLLSSATLGTVSPAMSDTLSKEESDYLLAIGRLLYLKKQDDAASQLIGRLDASSLRMAWRGLPFVQPLILHYVKARLDLQDFNAAAAMIGKMRQAQMEETEACETLLLMRLASYARRQERYGEAMEVLAQRLAPISPELAKERMGATLAEARDSLSKTGNYGEIIALHLKWANYLAPETRSEMLAVMYRDWGIHLLEQDQPAQARAVLQQYYLLSPQADQSLIDRCTYKETALSLERIDYASHFELAQWAAERGLVDEAIEAFEIASRHPELKDAATTQINQLRERVAIAYLDRCVKLFEQGDPRGALDEMNKMPFMPATRKIQPEMAQLRALCYAELKRRADIRAVQAETLFQDAQRRFFLGSQDSSIQDLKQIVHNFSDTPVAARASEFLRYAQTRKQLDKMDGSGPASSPVHAQLQPGPALEKEVRSLMDRLSMDEKPTSPTLRAR